MTKFKLSVTAAIIPLFKLFFNRKFEDGREIEYLFDSTTVPLTQSFFDYARHKSI